MGEFKSFYKVVGGNEGNKCHYNARLDMYGCGCQHDCNYCYAKSLLDFRGLWDAKEPAVADIDKIKRKIKKLPKDKIVRLGGMTDCFQPIEAQYGITYEAIKELNEQGIGYLIVTKSDLIATDKYIDVLDKRLAHIQITITSTDDATAMKYEKAVPISKRIKAIEKLCAMGFDVQVRLSPFIPEYVDFGVLNAIKCNKILVEFLRVNHWIEKWFSQIDFSKYTVKQSGYKHLPLNEKIGWIEKITGFDEVSVCEDEDSAYYYWMQNVNHNPDDCCNLKK